MYSRKPPGKDTAERVRVRAGSGMFVNRAIKGCSWSVSLEIVSDTLCLLLCSGTHEPESLCIIYVRVVFLTNCVSPIIQLVDNSADLLK